MRSLVSDKYQDRKRYTELRVIEPHEMSKTQQKIWFKLGKQGYTKAIVEQEFLLVSDDLLAFDIEGKNKGEIHVGTFTGPILWDQYKGVNKDKIELRYVTVYEKKPMPRAHRFEKVERTLNV